jgi:hypothetical protein
MCRGNPVATGTYSGNAIGLPMNLKQVAPRVGIVHHVEPPHTAPELAVFVVLADVSSR